MEKFSFLYIPLLGLLSLHQSRNHLDSIANTCCNPTLASILLWASTYMSQGTTNTKVYTDFYIAFWDTNEGKILIDIKIS